MARTTIPKEDPARRNKHTDLVLDRRTDGVLLGPPLPAGVYWHEATIKWYETWQRAPIAPMLEDTDWEELLLCALAHNKIWMSIDRISVAQMTTGLAEIRQRVAKMGATYEDRLKLRIKFADATIKEDQANPLADVRKQNVKEMFSDEEVIDAT